jgi:hypothetical protein
VTDIPGNFRKELDRSALDPAGVRRHCHRGLVKVEQRQTVACLPLPELFSLQRGVGSGCLAPTGGQRSHIRRDRVRWAAGGDRSPDPCLVPQLE